MVVHNPDIGRVLPVYVADEYEGFDAITYDKLSDDQLDDTTSTATSMPCARSRPTTRRTSRWPTTW